MEQDKLNEADLQSSSKIQANNLREEQEAKRRSYLSNVNNLVPNKNNKGITYSTGATRESIQKTV